MTSAWVVCPALWGMTQQTEVVAVHCEKSDRMRYIGYLLLANSFWRKCL